MGMPGDSVLFARSSADDGEPIDLSVGEVTGEGEGHQEGDRRRFVPVISLRPRARW
jgi:hypothetical protein